MTDLEFMKAAETCCYFKLSQYYYIFYDDDGDELPYGKKQICNVRGSGKQEFDDYKEENFYYNTDEYCYVRFGKKFPRSQETKVQSEAKVQPILQDSGELEEIKCQQRKLQEQQNSFLKKQNEMQKQQQTIEQQQQLLAKKMLEFIEQQKVFQKKQEEQEAKINAIEKTSNSAPASISPSYATNASQKEYKANPNCPYMN